MSHAPSAARIVRTRASPEAVFEPIKDSMVFETHMQMAFTMMLDGMTRR